jgi:hypothetical protein
VSPTGTSGLAVVVLHALAAPRDTSLDALLGPGPAEALRDEVVVLARRWAAEVAPGLAYEATTVGAAGAAVHGHEGPVILVATDVPRLEPGFAEAAVADLAHGALVSVAPSSDGTPFLVAVADADLDEDLITVSPFERVGQDERMTRRGVGLLRTERRLVSAADALALAADPLAPPSLRRFLPRP